MTAGLLLLLLGLSAAPPEGAPAAFPRGEIVARVECSADPSHSYALYLPKAYSENRKWPLLYLYDPGKNGPRAAERFHDAAERYGWILVSSNDTRSDGPMAPNVAAVKAMWSDANRRFPIDPRRVYAAGFSGGARMACLLAQKMEGDVAGVILSGAGFPDGSPPKKEMRFAVFGAVGNVDFNYGEMRRLDRTLGKLGATHRLAVFDGGHSWCPAPVCQEAVEWMEIQAMKEGSRAKDVALIEHLFQDALAKADALEKAGRTAQAFLRYTEISEDFSGLGDTKGADGPRARLGGLDPVRKELAEQDRREEAEASLADRLWADLTAALATDPPLPFRAIVNQLQVPKLRHDSAPERPEPDRSSARRVVEQIFVQTAFYLPRDFASKHDFFRAELAIRLAGELKPDRAGVAWYNLACFRATSGDRKGALASLRNAVEKGYRDVAALEADPDLESLRGEKSYREIVTELKLRPTS
jgi:predicted esterase